MRNLVIASLFACICINVASAAAVYDKTCTNKAGDSHPCTLGQFTRGEHIKACGQEWKTAKADASVKSAGWPAFWHQCSDKLKAAATSK